MNSRKNHVIRVKLSQYENKICQFLVFFFKYHYNQYMWSMFYVAWLDVVLHLHLAALSRRVAPPCGALCEFLLISKMQHFQDWRLIKV